jgi:hypothetical protein
MDYILAEWRKNTKWERKLVKVPGRSEKYPGQQGEQKATSLLVLPVTYKCLNETSCQGKLCKQKRTEIKSYIYTKDTCRPIRSPRAQ